MKLSTQRRRECSVEVDVGRCRTRQLAVAATRASRRRRSPRTCTTLLVRLVCVWGALDEETPRHELDGLTPAEIDSIAPCAHDHVGRAGFYRDVCQELERAALAPTRPRARRMQEREIIWSALERHGLVNRTRGGCPIPTDKAEGIS